MAKNICPVCQADLTDRQLNLQESDNPSDVPLSIIIGSQCSDKRCDYRTIIPDAAFDAVRIFVELNESGPNFPAMWPLLLESVEASIINKKPVPEDIRRIFTPIMREQLYASSGGKNSSGKDVDVVFSVADGKIVWDLHQRE